MCCIAFAHCLPFIPRNSPHLPQSFCILGFIYKLAVKCCSLFDSLQLIAHNLFRFQDALFINDDIFQRQSNWLLCILHIFFIFLRQDVCKIILLWHKHRQDYLVERPEVLYLILSLTCCRLWVSHLIFLCLSSASAEGCLFF